MSSENLHAPRDRLAATTLTHHHAIVSLKEELEAADWYNQRADDCEDDALKEILLHNMREEIEHACMILEWLRRNVPEWTKQMGAYLYSEGPITEVEEAETGKSGAEPRVEVDNPAAPIERTSGSSHVFTVGPLRGKGAS